MFSKYNRFREHDVVTMAICLIASLTVYQKSYQVLLACSAILGSLNRFIHYYFLSYREIFYEPICLYPRCN